MKQTLVLTKIEEAAFKGAMGDVVRARQVLGEVNATAEGIVAEILLTHGAPAVAMGATVSGIAKDGRFTLEYQSGEHPTGGNGDSPTNIVQAPINRVAEAVASGNGQE